ncbi:hypothetical protein D0T12_03875 [Actinomadura spongiicola]|uniref:SCP2 domain-containing protein n=1 Tax=Actinomadura spongiicola TaxID=2303421 RepID=A0A372GPS0_9ACTN|nr:hypothetical protein [Actinomadura spongiicola]RFS87376.1 hypothetical protein D0T12_03875 [Actinomadura spongiicola]
MITFDVHEPGVSGDILVTVEDDPTPFVLSLARTIRAACRHPDLLPVVEKSADVVGVRSSTDHQSATLRFGRGGVRVVHGVSGDADLVVGCDPATEFEVHALPGTPIDGGRLAALNAVLNPPLPSWQDAATRFWSLTGDDPGMPGQIVVKCSGSGEELVLGDGPAGVVLTGSADQLARTFSGLGNLFDDLYSGALSLVGTLPQLSVLCGAHWKVKFHG